MSTNNTFGVEPFDESSFVDAGMPPDAIEDAQALWANYYFNLRDLFFSALLYAMETGEQAFVDTIRDLNAHGQKHMRFQHPEIRGLVVKGAVNPTEQLLLSIIEKHKPAV